MEEKKELLSALNVMDGNISLASRERLQSELLYSDRALTYKQLQNLSNHWLINKALSITSEDSIRNGWLLNIGNGKELLGTDHKYDVYRHLRDVQYFGNVYGGRVVVFKVGSDDPNYYTYPFNIDAVKLGTYKGMVQISPQYFRADTSTIDYNNPLAENYYSPTHYFIGETRVHTSHLYIVIPHPVEIELRPKYEWLGLSKVQMVMEKVYASERAAEESVALLTSKRLIGLKLSSAALANPSKLEENLTAWSALMNNFGIRTLGQDEDILMHDTQLGSVIDIVNAHYTLVAAAFGIPANKLLELGTTGLNNTGEYQLATYREKLESIQTNTLEPLLVKHYMLVGKSMGLVVDDSLDVIWQDVSSPSATEQMELEKLRAERDAILYDLGVVDSEDIRNSITTDNKHSLCNLESKVEQ